MAKGPQRTLKIEIRIEGARETIAAFNRLPKEANKALRERSMALANTIATKVRVTAYLDSKQSALMAPTVKAVLDRLPSIVAGGTKRVGRNRRPAYKILFGSEFGSNLPQFRPHLGKGSYWFYRTVYDSQREIADAWNKAADDIQRDFTKDGG